MSGINFTIDQNHVATLQVDRPAVRNALDWDAMQAFGQAIQQAEAAEDLRALIVTGGGRTFVSGGDLKVLQHHPTKEDGLRLATQMGDALARLEMLPVPTIAAINGPARGGGAEITVACDMSIIAEDADIGFVHTRLGIITAWGGGQRLLREVGYAAALELMTSGRVVSPQEALRLRLVNRVVPAGQAYSAALELAAEIASRPPQAIQAAKRVLRNSIAHPQGDAYMAEREEFPLLWDSGFRREALRRFLDKGKPPPKPPHTTTGAVSTSASQD
ncbi:MAG: enoyl-CoA hydratase/isomerase family protein [Anaerolineae bacterium]|nr:enoyl-CoA hydratase/isomerase family protein [Anaerolineae bacterium]